MQKKTLELNVSVAPLHFEGRRTILGSTFCGGYLSGDEDMQYILSLMKYLLAKAVVMFRLNLPSFITCRCLCIFRNLVNVIHHVMMHPKIIETEDKNRSSKVCSIIYANHTSLKKINLI